jgi:hypothetical protein
LIAAGLRPIGPDFGPLVDQRWRRTVFDYMTELYDRVMFTPDISIIEFANARKRGSKMAAIKLPRRVSDILKTTVLNRHREKLGTIQDLMVGEDGRLKYAILSHGGFLEIGEVLIPIPFDALMMGGEKGTAVLEIDKQTLEKSLNLETGTWLDFTAAEWEEKIDRYFTACAACASRQ